MQNGTRYEANLILLMEAAAEVIQAAQWRDDTANNLLKIRNEDNTAWITSAEKKSFDVIV